MAPPNTQKRVKGISIFRPFVYGTTAKLFDPETNPKPADCPPDHTHSWTVFVKGVDDTDITYWLKKVQFKLHESIPSPLRTIENIPPGEPFEVHETGWGEFEITIKLYYVPESNEKAQPLYHHLRLHPYGDTEEAKEKMREQKEIISWVYEEQCFNEPYETFYEILTSPMDRQRGGKGGLGKGTKLMRGGMVSSIGERTAAIPLGSRPGQPFSRETEREELSRLRKATIKVEETMKELLAEKEAIDAQMAQIKAST